MRSIAPTADSFGNGALYTFQPAGPLTGNDQTIITTGPASPLATQNKGQKGYAIGDELTLQPPAVADRRPHRQDRHQVQVESSSPRRTPRTSIRSSTTTSAPAGTAAISLQGVLHRPGAGPEPGGDLRNQQLGIYLQDDWAATTKLTVNLGVRWDYERTPAYLDHVTPANVVAALFGPNPALPSETYAQALALGGINVNDYISNGHNRSAYTGEIAPRLGFSYDLQADQRHVLFGGAGRAYDRDLFDYLQLEETKQALPTFNMFFNVPDHPCVLGPTLRELGSALPQRPGEPAGAGRLDQRRRGGGHDQQQPQGAVFGPVQPRHPQHASATGIPASPWRASSATTASCSRSATAIPNGAFFQNGGNQFNSQNAVPGFGNLIIGNNGIETRDTELLLEADKPFTRESHWGATIAYTYSNATQNRDITQHYSFDEPTIRTTRSSPPMPCPSTGW